MRGFKSFIAEAKTKTFRDYLVPIPHHEMLDHHLDFAQHGIKLPDDPNLMKHTHNPKIVVQHLPDGGHITFNKDHYQPGTYYVDAKDDSHRSDGPAIIEAQTGIHRWMKHGVEVARWTPPQPMGAPVSSGTVREGNSDWARNEFHTKPESFNAALTRHHGFPAFDHSTIKTKWQGSGDDEY